MPNPPKILKDLYLENLERNRKNPRNLRNQKNLRSPKIPKVSRITEFYPECFAYLQNKFPFISRSPQKLFKISCGTRLQSQVCANKRHFLWVNRTRAINCLEYSSMRDVSKALYFSVRHLLIGLRLV